MPTKLATSNQAESYLHSHIWLVISVVVVGLAAVIIGFFLFESRSLKKVSDGTEPTSVAQLTDETDQGAAAGTAPASSTPEVSANTVVISTDASAATVTKEINSIDVAAIQADLEELQATLANFSSLTE